MVRINLLPPEIIERRKYERFYPYIFITAGILLAVVLVVWGIAQYYSISRQSELQQIQNSTAKIRAQADSFAVFEKQRQELEDRKSVADQALADRVNMSGLAYDISLILPDEAWLGSLLCNEKAGVTLAGFTPDTDSEGISEGYKSVAAMLVRLSALDQLVDVWLTNASSQRFDDFQPLSTESSTTVVGFDVTARITTATPTASAE